MPLEKLYFRHEWHARSSPKLTDIKMEMQMEGIGIYWCLIEFMYEEGGFLNESKLKTLAYNEHISINKIKKVLELGKFKYNEEKGYYCNGVLERIKKREDFSAKQKEKADKRWTKEKEKKQAPIPDWYTEEYEKEREEQFNKNKQNALDSLNKLKENK